MEVSRNRRILLATQDEDTLGIPSTSLESGDELLIGRSTEECQALLHQAPCDVFLVDAQIDPKLVLWLSEVAGPLGLPPVIWVGGMPLISGDIGGAQTDWIRDLRDPVELHFRIDQLLRNSGTHAELGRMQYLADHDALTGLPNRRHFFDRIDGCVRAASRENFAVAVLFIDLDGFKAVNDSLGHDAGDQLLTCIAERVTAHVRSSDSLTLPDKDDPATVSRLGGDEFALLLSRVDGPMGAEIVADRLAAVIAEPMEINGHEITVSASIGISLLPGDADSPDLLLSHADQAMYQAKQRGPNNFAFYDEGMDSASLRRLTVATRLRRSLEHAELEVAYQPRIDIATGRAVGAEVLARWNDDTLGIVKPDEFIPVAESTGLILPLGRAVLNLACAQVREWLDAGYTGFSISVNVSPQQFAREDVVSWVTETLTHYRVPPEYLELEITENLFLAKTERITETLTQLRAMGMRIALDDFGTGYSSLSFVLQFPIDTLKMDRCLIKNITDDEGAAGVVKALIEMARAMRIQIVAEGVDTEAQAEWLRKHGCDEFQGFLRSGAVSAEELANFLEVVD